MTYVRSALVRVLLAVSLVTLSLPNAALAQPPHKDTVVLLHGLAGSSLSMMYLDLRLQAAGYHVENVSYPSTDRAPEDVVAYVADELDRRGIPDKERVHFVTLSLGGVIVRAYLDDDPLDNLGRVVMLGPPNQGSELVDTLSAYRVFARHYGPTGLSLGTDASSFPNRLGPVDYELGVIAGTDWINPLGRLLLKGPHDGTVTVARTRVDGMTDFMTHPVSHTFLPFNVTVASKVHYFLQHGAFTSASHTT